MSCVLTGGRCKSTLQRVHVLWWRLLLLLFELDEEEQGEEGDDEVMQERQKSFLHSEQFF
jgi:hypothetical protein